MRSCLAKDIEGKAWDVIRIRFQDITCSTSHYEPALKNCTLVGGEFIAYFQNGSVLPLSKSFRLISIKTVLEILEGWPAHKFPGCGECKCEGKYSEVVKEISKR